MESTLKTFSATFRLLKEDKKIENALAPENQLKRVSTGTSDTLTGIRIYVGQVYESNPTWLDLISEITDSPIELENKGAAAVIFVSAEDRLFAVSFGMAQICLNRDAFECDFGLKVCLNKIPRDKIKTLDTASPDSTTIQKRIQASAESDFSLFSVDIEKDILRLLAGKPAAAEKEFASSMSGRDCLHLTCKLSINSLQKKCKELLHAYHSTEYKNNYPWIDYIRQIRDHEVISKLNDELSKSIDALRADIKNDLCLSIPEIIDPAVDYAYRYNGLSCRSQKYNTLSIDDYKKELGKEPDDERSNYADHRISMISGNLPHKEFSVLECLNFEAQIDGKKYILWSSSWYEIDSDFAEEIEQTWTQALVVKEYLLKETKKKTEAELISDLENSKNTWQKLDKRKINPTNTSYAHIEPCDFFVPPKSFYHLKDGTSSSCISHLWNQGLVSGECFLSDQKFRKELRNMLNDSLKTQVPSRKDTMPIASQYKIIFGVMREPSENGDIKIPFFSKVSFRSVFQRLTMLGFQVFVNPIKKV